MSFNVSIQPNDINFTTTADATLLDSALAAKINLPHGCKNGGCGACKCKLTSGSVTHQEYEPSALSPQELADNTILLCKASATSDVVLDIPGFVNGFPIKTLPSKIESIEKIGSVAILKLKLPANQSFEFFAGQYIDLSHAGKNRSYSLANSPSATGIAELHIRYRPGGVFSEALWNDFKAGQIIRFKGPLGSFTLQDSAAPILMVCTGTGFAPLKSILEYMLTSNSKRKVHLIWGNFQPEDFYLTELLPMWQQHLDLSVTLCSNENTPADYYHGLVTEYIAQNYPDLSQYQVYACGNPGMIESLYNSAISELNLVKTNFFSDVFTPSA